MTNRNLLLCLLAALVVIYSTQAQAQVPDTWSPMTVMTRMDNLYLYYTDQDLDGAVWATVFDKKKCYLAVPREDFSRLIEEIEVRMVAFEDRTDDPTASELLEALMTTAGGRVYHYFDERNLELPDESDFLCVPHTFLLIRVLSHFDIKGEIVVGDSIGDGVDHAFVQVVFANATYLLDALNGNYVEIDTSSD